MTPPTLLMPMRPEVFASFTEEAIARYAQDSVEASRWQPDEALPRAREEFARLLPHGQQTPRHQFHEIHEQGRAEPVGELWLAVQEAGSVRTGYLYNIHVKPAFRGRGHAKAALELAEARVAAQGATSLALHVFVFNTGAQALYRSLGYGITGLNMFKQLRRDGAR